MAKSIWELEEEVRRQLRRGVELEGHKVAISVGTDMFTWVDLKEDRLMVVYIKDTYRVTVHASVRGDSVEILSVSLDTMCVCVGR
jgi:hypothetical protein